MPVIKAVYSSFRLKDFQDQFSQYLAKCQTGQKEQEGIMKKVINNIAKLECTLAIKRLYSGKHISYEKQVDLCGKLLCNGIVIGRLWRS
jgi:hypothetical protein